MQDTLVAPGSYRGAPIPWWGKIAAKVILSRLPVPHALWSKLNIFRHSYSSEDADQLVRRLEARIAWFRSRTGRIPRTVLELGPGEITTCAVAYRALGVERTIFVDVGDFGSRDVRAYVRVAAAAKERGLVPPQIEGAADRAQIFARCGAEYCTDGLVDLRRIPPASIDLVTSVAVIEHIRRTELRPTFDELRRVMSRDGLAWHAIDFQDHLGGKLANLRFTPAIWESRWMSSSGFYTNRASPSQVVEMLQRTGLAVEVEARGLWPEPPIARSSIAPELRNQWTNEDLRVCSMSLSARAIDASRGSA
jgi:hypothetical protein